MEKRPWESVTARCGVLTSSTWTRAVALHHWRQYHAADLAGHRAKKKLRQRLSADEHDGIIVNRVNRGVL
jgi:hypothetical protein